MQWAGSKLGLILADSKAFAYYTLPVLTASDQPRGIALIMNHSSNSPTNSYTLFYPQQAK